MKQCVMLPWLFNHLIDETVRKLKARIDNAGVKMKTILFVDDTVLMSEWKEFAKNWWKNWMLFVTGKS